MHTIWRTYAGIDRISDKLHADLKTKGLPLSSPVQPSRRYQLDILPGSKHSDVTWITIIREIARVCNITLRAIRLLSQAGQVVSFHSTSAELIRLSDMLDLLQCSILCSFPTGMSKVTFPLLQDNTSTSHHCEPGSLIISCLEEIH